MVVLFDPACGGDCLRSARGWGSIARTMQVDWLIDPQSQRVLVGRWTNSN